MSVADVPVNPDEVGVDAAETPWWVRHGYVAGKTVAGGHWVCLAPMIFTWRLMICTEYSVLDFYCYPGQDLPLAQAAFHAWDGLRDPLPGWVRHHGAPASEPS
jgi:hypothetical protein